MKSESSVRPFEAPIPVGDAFRAFFDVYDAPAALCDLTLTVLTANSAFEVLCGTRDVVGQTLAEVLTSAPLTVPDEGRSLDVEVECRTAQSVTLSVVRRGKTVAVVARRLSPMLDSLAAAGRALLEQARIETQLLEIGRELASATGEEELVAAAARGVKGLFPGRTFCVRIVDPRTCALTSLYAEGRLKEGPRDVFGLRRSMVEKTHLDLASLPRERVVLSQDLPLLFQGSVKGLVAPLVASGQFFGAVNVEYPAGLTADAVLDERVVIQLANQIAVAVRNAKLIDELTFVRKYLENLLENANALILVVNRDRKVVVFNQALVALTGRAAEDVLGIDAELLVPEQDRLRVLKALSGSLAREPVSSFETALTKKDGRETSVAFNVSAVSNQAGEVEGVIAIGHDVSRMRELERRIVQAEKLASLGQLAASVVHEINNPMTAVATYADALLKRAMLSPTADPSDVTKFRKIVDNSERVLRFTRDLVSYARPAHDKPEEVDLNATLERALGFCEHVVVRHGVKLERNYADVPRFLGLKQNLVQVFVNLVTNACHATPSGGSITVSSRALDGFAVVEVKDTGRGMASEVRARIFEPFFTTKPDGQGTGLGLSIVHGIIENHGGVIDVASETGQGTTFTVRLPMLRWVAAK